MSGTRSPRNWRDLRILSLEQAAALPFATCHLADLGAEVIRVQAPGSAPRGLTEPSLLRGKRLLGLDLAKPGGAAAFRDLAAGCDVVAHNFTPRVMRKYGIDFEAIRAVQPEIVYCALTGYGSTGPWSERPLFGPGAEALAGHNLLIGSAASDIPGRPGTVTYADYLCGLNLVVALLGAFVARFAGATTAARFIDVSLYETAVTHLSSTIVQRQFGGRLPQPLGNADRGYAVHGVFACAGQDRYIAIAADAVQAASLRSALAILDSADTTLLGAAIAACERDALVQRLAGAGVPCCAVRDAADIYAAYRLGGSSPFGECVTAQQRLLVPGPAWGGGPSADRCFVESLGDCHDDVLARVANYDDERIAALRASGALAERAVRYGIAASDSGLEIARGFVSRVDPLPAPSAVARHADADVSASTATRPLAWPLRVVEVAGDAATAWAGRLLAAQGCEVVSLPMGAPGFRAAVSRWGDAAGVAQLVFDANKTVVADVADHAGDGRDCADTVPSWLEDSDVVLHGPHSPLRHGASVGAWQSRQSLPLQQHSVAVDSTSADLLLQAASGFLFITGEAGDGPQQLPPHAASHLAGAALAACTLARLVAPQSAPAQVAQADAAAVFAHVAVGRYAVTGEVARREGRVKHAVRMARAADRFLYCAPGAVQSFDAAAFAALLGEPQLADERFATAEGRLQHWLDYQSLVAARLRTRSAAAWVDAAAAAHLTFAHVQNVDDLLACPQLKTRRLFASVDWFGRRLCVPRGPIGGEEANAVLQAPRFVSTADVQWRMRRTPRQQRS